MNNHTLNDSKDQTNIFKEKGNNIKLKDEVL